MFLIHQIEKPFPSYIHLPTVRSILISVPRPKTILLLKQLISSSSDNEYEYIYLSPSVYYTVRPTRISVSRLKTILYSQQLLSSSSDDEYEYLRKEEVSSYVGGSSSSLSGDKILAIGLLGGVLLSSFSLDSVEVVRVVRGDEGILNIFS
mmetsp:Transcript_7649/g.8412  ORF Transcript_7649/g.8412 Transcript_7649/m.8412 type:complete len:150 (+) Transcript_7649:176-625(+)